MTKVARTTAAATRQRRNTMRAKARRALRRLPKVITMRRLRRVPAAVRAGKLAADLERAREARERLATWPVYLVNAHGCVCPPRGVAVTDTAVSACDAAGRAETFRLGADTVLMTFAQGGDYCVGSSMEDDVVEHKCEIRKFALMHSASDIGPIVRPVGRGAGFFSGMRRATTGSEYPNLLLSFREEGGLDDEDNQLGVYRIDTLSPGMDGAELENEEHSIVKVAEGGRAGEFFLQDLIERVYARTGDRRGIFVLVACMGACSGGAGRRELAEIEQAQRLIQIANAEYTGVIPTVTAKEAAAGGIAVPFDYSLEFQASEMTAEYVLGLIKGGLIDVQDVRKLFDLDDIDEDEREKLYKMHTNAALAGRGGSRRRTSCS